MRWNCRASVTPAAPPMSSGRSAFLCRPRCSALCEFVVKIPTRFSINVGMAGAIVLYDRLMNLGGYGGAAGDAGRGGAGHAAAAYMGRASGEAARLLALENAAEMRSI